MRTTKLITISIFPELLKEAERIATQIAEHIRRCEYSGEILSGGNRYVHVRHSDECREIMARRWLDQVEEVVRSLPELVEKHGSNILAPIPGTKTEALIGQENAHMMRLWTNGRAGMTFGNDPASLKSIAFTLALEEDQA